MYHDLYADLRHYLKIIWLLSICPSTGRIKTILKNQTVDTREKKSEDVNNHCEEPQKNSLEQLQSHQCTPESPWKKIKRLQVDKRWGNWNLHVYNMTKRCYTWFPLQEGIHSCYFPHQHCYSGEWVFAWNLNFLGEKIHPWDLDENRYCLLCLSCPEGWINPWRK